LIGQIVNDALAIIMPFLAVILLIGVLSNVLQVGILFTAFPIKPDFTKLNPAKSLKRIFSKKTLFELFKSSLKICLFGALVYFLGEDVIADVLVVYQVAPEQMVHVWAGLFFKLAIWVLAFLIPVAMLDYAFTNFDFMKQMMMSTREVKDEHKKREGDPEIKSKQKQIQKELAKKAASLGSVKDADVVITNPTHIAVALRYRIDEMGAPKIMAMGQDNFAEKIKTVARLHRIPIVQNKAAARRIYANSVVDGYIPFDCYDLVAPIFRWVMELRGESFGGNA
jgi:flagellar biosynthesis protein FlhB